MIIIILLFVFFFVSFFLASYTRQPVALCLLMKPSDHDNWQRHSCDIYYRCEWVTDLVVILHLAWRVVRQRIQKCGTGSMFLKSQSIYIIILPFGIDQISYQLPADGARSWLCNRAVKLLHITSWTDSWGSGIWFWSHWTLNQIWSWWLLHFQCDLWP